MNAQGQYRRSPYWPPPTPGATLPAPMPQWWQEAFAAARVVWDQWDAWEPVRDPAIAPDPPWWRRRVGAGR